MGDDRWAGPISDEIDETAASVGTGGVATLILFLMLGLLMAHLLT